MNKFINKYRISPHVITYFLLVLGIALSLFAYVSVKNRLEMQTKATFIQKTDTISNLIVDRLNLYIGSLYSIQGLYATSEEVTRDEFIKYTTSANIFSRFPGISSFAYALKVNKKELTVLEKKTSQELTTTLLVPTNYKVHPQSENEEYYPVLYMSPFTTDKNSVIGFDYLSETNRKSALELARDQNQAIATAKIILSTTQKPAFDIIVPIYKNNNPIETLSDRNKNIMGIIIGSFHPEDLFSKLLENTSEEKGIDFEVFDGEDQTNITDDRLLFDLDQGKYSRDPNYKPRFSNIKSINIASRPWTIKYYSLPDLETNYLTDRLPLLVLLSGIDISLLVFFILHLVTTSDERALKFSQKILSVYKAHDKLHSHTRVEPIQPQKPKPEPTISIK